MNRRHWISLMILAAMFSIGAAALSAGVVKSDNKAEKHMSKNDLLAQAYRDGLIVAYLDAGGRMKVLSARNADELEKAKQKILQNYDKKKAVYDKGRENYLKKNPELKYSQLPPVEPSFKPIEPDIKLKGDRITNVAPKDNFYALYKVEADGKTTYEAGLSFSDVLQRQKHERGYIQRYNAWVRSKKKGDEPAEPKYEKVVSDLNKNMAARAQAEYTAWQKKHEAWEKGGKKGDEPPQPETNRYQETEDSKTQKSAEGRKTKKPAEK